MSMCRAVSCVGRGCLLWPMHCFILYSKTKFACYSRYLLTFYFCILIPMKKFLVLVLKVVVGLQQPKNHSTSASLELMVIKKNCKVKQLSGRIAKTNRVLPRKCTGHNKHRLPTTQEKTLHMDITRWSISKSDWLYSLQPKMEKLYRVNKKQNQKQTVAQIMNSLLTNLHLNWRK